MAVSGGYPEDFEKGKVITGLDNVDKESVVFQAGTKLKGGDIITSGGRVFSVTSWGKNIGKALSTSYRNLSRINFEGIYYRKDIGFDL
jgi:phosphoribosylamine--glycine ligase